MKRRLGDVFRGNKSSPDSVPPAEASVDLDDESEVARLRKQVARLEEEHVRLAGRLAKAEHVAGVGVLAAAMSHEIAAALTVIGGRVESVLSRDELGDDVRRSLDGVAEQVGAAGRLVRGLLDLSRARELRLRQMDILTVLGTVMGDVASHARAAGIAMRLDAPDDLPLIEADAEQLHQVFQNLVRNAVEAMPRGGQLRLSADFTAADASRAIPRTFVTVTVEDSGIGMSPEHLGQIFGAFFTTKGGGRGTGLGLHVSREIVQAHGGSFDVWSEVGVGTRMTVSLPLRADGA